MFIITAFLESFVVLILLLVAIAILTLVERKVLAITQRRQGPNVIGLFGLLQPIADGFKLLIKEPLIPSNANKILFIISPMISFQVSLLGWSVIPFSKHAVFADVNLGLLLILSVSSVGVYGIIVSGWSSNSKYSFLGALRSSAQMISYELAMGFSILAVIYCSESMRIIDIVNGQRLVWYWMPLLVSAIVFFIAGLAETNRHPFDLPEAESELVAGYNLEYAGMAFAFFSLAEYSNILMMCALNSILFFGGWLPPFAFLSFIPGQIWLSLKIAIFAVLFIYIRAAVPRYRYDQLMDLGWKILLPISFGYLFFFIGLMTVLEPIYIYLFE